MSETPKFYCEPQKDQADPQEIQKKFNKDVQSIDESEGLPTSALPEALVRKAFKAPIIPSKN